MKGLLCFDYDMTLFDHGSGRIPDSALRAIAALRGEWKIAIATGRDMLHADAQYGLQAVRPDAVVHMNGARVEADGQVLYRYFLPQALVDALLAFAKAQGLCIGCAKGAAYYCTQPQRLRDFFARAQNSVPLDVFPLESLPAGQAASLVLVGGKREAALLESRFPDVHVPLFAGKEGADIIPRELSKAKGVQKLLTHYGLSFAQVVFFGDSGNDLELMQAAGLGIAMGNAIAPLKAAADYVTAPISADGVLRALQHFGLLRQDALC